MTFFGRIGGRGHNMKNIKRDYSVTDILLVEDNPGDSRLIEEAFRYSDRFIRLHVVQDGMEAMSFLRHEGNYRNSPRPNFILLDLNLPKMNGYEVLAQIKGDDNLKSIPTVILSCSRAEADTGLFRPIQHTASLMCSWRRRLPNSDGLMKRERPQHESSNCIQRFGTIANSRASSVHQNLRRLWAMRSAPPGCQSKLKLTSRCRVFININQPSARNQKDRSRAAASPKSDQVCLVRRLRVQRRSSSTRDKRRSRGLRSPRSASSRSTGPRPFSPQSRPSRWGH